MTADPESNPSLLDARARGGDTADAGFSFQEAVLLASVPRWLSFDGFTSLLREGVEDIEARFYDPSFGERIEAIQAKGCTLTPAMLYQELDRFAKLDAGSPNTFQWFTLASAGISDSLKPVANGLRRLRGPYGFYSSRSGVIEESFRQYSDAVSDLERPEVDAQFLFDRVLIDSGWPPSGTLAEALFRQSLVELHPDFEHLPAKASKAAFDALLNLVKARRAKPIERGEIEAIMDSARGPSVSPPRVLRVHTSRDDVPGPKGAIRLDWKQFFGGEARDYPPSDEWRQLTSQLVALREWTLRCGRPRRIALTGERRLTASLAFGAAFSAVSGFAIGMSVRGADWATDRHADSLTPAFAPEVSTPHERNERLIVSAAVHRPIKDEVRSAAASLGLGGGAYLDIFSPSAIQGPDHANAAVTVIKSCTADALRVTGARTVDLFFAGPAPLALFLGHRLNATAPVQCYEWVRVGEYTPSCTLFT